jgi:hypothetical protein|uniref:hypothetical protein n=1 Tax=Cephaloticoccus sp. TaxID=1985742 RepID=UPI0040494361
MNRKLNAITFILPSIWLSGCNTSTTHISPEDLATLAAQASPAEMFGGQIGMQLAAAERPGNLATTKSDAKLAKIDSKAYQDWKRANRS